MSDSGDADNTITKVYVRHAVSHFLTNGNHFKSLVLTPWLAQRMASVFYAMHYSDMYLDVFRVVKRYEIQTSFQLK